MREERRQDGQASSSTHISWNACEQLGKRASLPARGSSRGRRQRGHGEGVGVAEEEEEGK